MASNVVCKVPRISKMFPPIRQLPTATTITCKSYNHFIRSGIMTPLSTGFYAWLPLGYRVVQKLQNIIQHEMEKIEAQRIVLPALTDSSLWKQSSRLEQSKPELFMLKDRHDKEYLLNPTCEEQICKMISSFGLMSSKSLPLKLYQISSKWRDERRPRSGFLRSREFLMMDLYTFDRNLANAKQTYKLVGAAYDIIFQKIGIDVHKVIGENGTMGGKLSHEYHYKCDLGDDSISLCTHCHYAISKQLQDSHFQHCPLCSNDICKHNTTEVGHMFLLETKYSSILNVMAHEAGKTEPVSMGCFGIGIDRLITAAAEISSTRTELRWPLCLVPYTVCVVPPKRGSREESAKQLVNQVLHILDSLNVDTILDDRTDLTIGQRLVSARKVGYPYAIVISKNALLDIPLFEIHNVYTSERYDMPLESVYCYFKEVAHSVQNHIETTDADTGNIINSSSNARVSRLDLGRP